MFCFFSFFVITGYWSATAQSLRCIFVFRGAFPRKQKEPSGFLTTLFQRTRILSVSFITGWKLFLYLYDLPLIIGSASAANPMGHHQSAAFAALYQVRSAHFPICSPAVSSRFGRFIFRADRHSLHLLKPFGLRNHFVKFISVSTCFC